MSRHRKHPRKVTRLKASGEFQVGPGMLVEIEFTVSDEDGQPVPLADKRSEFIFGYGELLPQLELALDGALAGDVRTATLSPEDAFGPREASRMLEVDRDEFPPDIRGGDSLELENEHGRILVMRVLEVTEQTVVLDSNHPLAGQRLEYRLTVKGVRPATEAQLIEAERRALDSSDQVIVSEPALIAPETLIRSRRPGAAGEGSSPVPVATTDSDGSGDSGNEPER